MIKKLFIGALLFIGLDRGAFAAISQGDIAANNLLKYAPGTQPGDVLAITRPGVAGTATNVATAAQLADLQGQIDLWENPTNGITQAAADARYLISGVLLESNETYTAHATVPGAYAAAVSGNNILIGKGVYEIGYLTLDKPSVGFFGKGADLTTLHGAIALATTSVSNTIENLTLFNDTQAYTDTLVSRMGSTNEASLRMVNVDIVSAVSNINSLIMGVSGNGIYLENVNTRATVYPHGHNFVLIGAANARVVDCSSNGDSWNGLYIKSDSRSKGDTYNVFVSGFNGINGNGLLIQSAGTNSAISNITVVSSSFDRGVQFDSDNPISNTISNVVVDVSCRAMSVPLQITLAKVLNTTIKISGDVATTNSVHVSSTEQLGSNYKYTLDVVSPLGVATLSDSVYTFSAQSASVSSGTATNNLRAIASTNGALYIVTATNFEWKVANLYSNNPVWVESGTASGVYRLLSWGTSGTNDSPVVGAVAGDFYATCELGTLADNTNFTASVIRPGKAVAILEKSYSGVTAISTLVKSATKYLTGGNVSFIETYQGILLTTPPTVNVSSAQETVKYAGIGSHRARFVLFGGKAYLCVFGVVSSIDAYTPAVCDNPKVNVELYSEFTGIWFRKVVGLE